MLQVTEFAPDGSPHERTDADLLDLRKGDTTFWVARSGVTRRTRCTRPRPSSASDSSAAPATASPAGALATDTRLAATPSAACSAWTSGQWGRTQ